MTHSMLNHPALGEILTFVSLMVLGYQNLKRVTAAKFPRLLILGRGYDQPPIQDRKIIRDCFCQEIRIADTDRYGLDSHGWPF